jgi:dihydroorotase-like cyclic amidohydrolase
VFIEGEVISKILEVSKTISELKSEYPRYEWEDYRDLYISPGIIDLNVCFNNEVSLENEETVEYDGSAVSENSSCLTSSLPEAWEGYELGTKAAIAGGVTTVIETPSLIHKTNTLFDYKANINSLDDTRLYCDIGFLAQINNENYMDIEEISQTGVLGFKAYIIPPAFEIPCLSTENLEKVYQLIEKTNKPLFFHPEKASERYIYMSSPFRNENLLSRKYKPEPQFSALPGAFPEEIEGSGSEVSPINSSNSTPITKTPLSILKLDEKLLEKQILYQSNNIESLVKAEILTYSVSGFTVFEPESPIPSVSDSLLSDLKLEKSPAFKLNSPVNSVLSQGKSRRPPPIKCSKSVAQNEFCDYKTFLANCPPHWEVNGVQAILCELKKHPKCKVHITNISSANALYVIRKNKRDFPSLKLTSETSAYFLYFSDQHIKPGDTRFKSSPPIREEKNRKLMLEMLSLNSIDVVSSYHRPIKPSLKFLNRGDFKRALSGISCLGLTLQSVWTAIQGDPRAEACKMAKFLSQTPAEVIGLHNKGSIEVGKIADVVVWDPCAWAEVHNLSPGYNISPYVGEKLLGKISCTYLRGKLVYTNNNFSAYGRKI